MFGMMRDKAGKWRHTCLGGHFPLSITRLQAFQTGFELDGHPQSKSPAIDMLRMKLMTSKKIIILTLQDQ